MSYISACYTKSFLSRRLQNDQNDAVKEVNDGNKYSLTTMINTAFFDFTLHRTKYRVENAGNEIIEAIVLLGLYE
jgi:hypothetical protein